jgi:hypothetical protein
MMRLGYRIQGIPRFHLRDGSRLIDPVLSHHAMLPCSPNARYIPFDENMAIQIFSFSFRYRL